MHLERRVVITGLGALSPLGNSAQISWDACLKGTSGIQKIDFEIPDCPVSIGGKLKNFDVNEYLPAKESRRIDPFIQYGVIAANQAINDSGLSHNDYIPERVGVSFGSGIGGLHSIEKKSSYSERFRHPKGFTFLCSRINHQYDFWPNFN